MYPYIQLILPSYSVLAVLGGLITLIFLYFRIGRYNVQFSDFLKMFVISVVCGAIGSRLVYVVSRIPWLITHFSIGNLISNVVGGGFVFYGGLFGVIFGVYLYSKRRGYDRKNIFNMVAPAIPLFHSIGRIGCFMAGCCYGCRLPSAISVFGMFEIDRFPTQLIECFYEMILFVIIVICQRINPNRSYLRIYLISYAVFRFIVEFFRGDAIRGILLGISTSQLISLGILVFYAVIAVKSRLGKAELQEKESQP